MTQKNDEKIIELFTNITKNIDHKDEDIKRVTKEYMSYIGKDLKFTDSLLKELILKDRENTIHTTEEWFVETLGFNYVTVRKELNIDVIIGVEISLNKFVNELPIFLILFMLGVSVEKREWSIEKVRYMATLELSQLCQTTSSMVSSFLIVINQYFYNKIYKIQQNENVVYDCVFDVIKEQSPRLLSY